MFLPLFDNLNSVNNGMSQLMLIRHGHDTRPARGYPQAGMPWRQTSVHMIRIKKS